MDEMNQQEESRMKHIMVAIDGSEPSLRALEHAAGLAKSLEARLSVLIVREFVVGRKDVYPVLNKSEIDQIQKQAKEIATASGDPQAEFLVEESRDAAFTIVEAAIERGVDLIVMGASGKGGIKKFLLGSVSSEVLRKSACPVTIVH